MDNCPNCGADLPRNAKVCPECGSDEKTGWSDEAYASALNLPDDDFNYEKFVENEFGKKKKMIPNNLHWFWWLVAVLTVITFIFLWFRFRV